MGGEQKTDGQLDHKTEEVLELLKDKTIPSDKGELAKLISSILEDKILQTKKETSHIEKEKLYNQIKELKDENKQFKSNLELLLKQETEKKQREEELIKKQEDEKRKIEDDKKKAEMDLTERIKLLENELSNSSLKTEEVKKKSEELLTKAVEFTKEELRKKDLQLYIQQVINQNNGEIIPDLVAGNTVEEVDASLERAKKRYQELIVKKKEKDDQAMLNSGGVPRDTNDKVINKQLAVDNIWDLDNKSFNEYADSFIQSLLKP